MTMMIWFMVFFGVIVQGCSSARSCERNAVTILANITFEPTPHPTAHPSYSHSPTQTPKPTHFPTYRPSREPSASPTGCIAVSSSQMIALEEFYNSTNGLGWMYPTNTIPWNFSQPDPNPCLQGWAFITCSGCSIIDLEIQSNIGMIGTLPESISSLSHLKTLQINGNDDLIGYIPSTIGSLSKVTFLDLSENSLSGTIPDSIGNIYGLQELYLYSNQLWGTIPSSIGQVGASLEKLGLYYNMLEGPLPNSLGDLSKVQYMELYSNELTGTIPVSLCNLKINLERLYLYDNHLEGSIPDCIGEMTQLIRLYLQQNNLNGTIPQSIGQSLVVLQALRLYDNQLTGAVLNIEHNPVLDTLDLNTNHLTGSISSTYSKLPSLQYLDLSHNQLTGSIPTTLNFLHSLTDLYLNNNLLNGSLPETIGNLTSLQNLYLFYNELTGPLPFTLGRLRQLNDLDIYGNSFSGSLPLDLIDLRNLQSFTADSNQFTGSLSEKFGRLISLEFLTLSNNHFTNSIPSCIGMIPLLNSVHLNGNLFSQQIPSSLGNITTLTFLDISSNVLTGELPSSLGNLTNLIFLNTSNNLLTSTIVDNFFEHLQNLDNLDLSNNEISGSLPSSLGLLPKLAVLEFSNNIFSGPFPTTANWSSLAVMVFSNNYLSNSLPTYFQSLSSIQTVLIDNNFLSGLLSHAFSSSSSSSHVNLFPLLACLDLSSNFFSGSIPTSLFSTSTISSSISPLLSLSSTSISSSSLQVLVLANNCLTWKTFATDICQITSSLQYLILDGMNTGISCRTSIFPSHFHLSSTFTTKSAISSGSIPSCLFNNAPSLHSLHLVNTGIFGEFLHEDDLITMPSMLSDLAVSYNSLLGTIPNRIQSYPNYSTGIDLSYNRLYGTLSNSIPSIYDSASSINGTIPSMVLDVNRLSGLVPRALFHAKAINILTGNLFNCHPDRSDLPSNDPNRDTFNCGSQLANETILVWVACIVFAISMFGLPLFIFFQSQKNRQSIPSNEGNPQTEKNDENNVDISKNVARSLTPLERDLTAFLQYWYKGTAWGSTHDPTRDSDLSATSTPTSGPGHNEEMMISLRHFLFTLFRRLLWYMVFLVVVCIPVTLCLAAYYPTVHPDYAWTVSFANKAGIVPASCLLLIILTVYLFVWYWWCRPWLTVAHGMRAWSRSLQRSRGSISVSSSTDVTAFLRQHEQQLREREALGLKPLLPTCCTQKTIWYWLGIGGIILAIAIVSVFLINILFISLVSSPHHNSSLSIHTYNNRNNDVILLFITIITSLYKVIYSIVLHTFSKYIVNDIYLFLLHPWGTILYNFIQESIVFVIFFGNLLAPCLALLFNSENCLYHAFVPSPPVISSYNYQIETKVQLPTTIYYYNLQVTNKQLSIDSSFQYDFNCSSTMLTTFANIFIFRCLIKSFFFPLGVLLMRLIQSGLVLWYTCKTRTNSVSEANQPSVSADGSNSISVNVENPLHVRTDHSTASTSTSISLSYDHIPLHSFINIHLPYCWKYYPEQHTFPNNYNEKLVPTINRSKFEATELHDPTLYRIFHSSEYVTNAVTDLAIVLTFGLLFPPLGIIGSISMILDGCWKLLGIGRMMCLFESDKVFQRLQLSKLQEELFLLQDYFIKACWKMLVMILPCIWGIFVFDMLGGVMGTEKSWWVLVVIMIGFPACLCCLQYVIDYMVGHSKDNSDTVDHSEIQERVTTIEMQ